MTELLPIQGLYAIEVPEDAYTFSIENNTLICLTGEEGFTFKTFLPPGSYEILLTTKDCSETDAESVGVSSKWLLLDILRANGLSTDKNYLLIKSTPKKQ